jgi:hypothetical protein
LKEFGEEEEEGKVGRLEIREGGRNKEGMGNDGK